MQINSDGTISSTTGAVADKEHDVALKIYKDVQAGLAYYDRDGTPIYYETPPDTSGENDPDGENGDQPDGEKPDGEESTGEGSDGGEEPAEPPAVTPEEPSEPGGTDGNTSDQGQ